MSWSFSLALVEEYSRQCSLGIELFAPLSLTPTPDQFYWPDKPTEHSRLSRFGMTCAPLMDGLGAELLTWFLEVSRARIYQSPEKVPGLMESAAGCGEKWRGSLARYDPDSHSLKTAQLSLLEDSTGCSVILPRSGTMRNGVCWELPMLARRISANESGYWPTPAQGGLNLRTAVSLWPTPTASAYKGWSPNHNRADTNDRLDYSVERECFVNGQQTPPMRLNPNWVEWLMGWPIGHTELKPLETDRFREFVQQHGVFCKKHGESAGKIGG